MVPWTCLWSDVCNGTKRGWYYSVDGTVFHTTQQCVTSCIVASTTSSRHLRRESGMRVCLYRSLVHACLCHITRNRSEVTCLSDLTDNLWFYRQKIRDSLFMWPHRWHNLLVYLTEVTCLCDLTNSSNLLVQFCRMSFTFHVSLPLVLHVSGKANDQQLPGPRVLRIHQLHIWYIYIFHFCI